MPRSDRLSHIARHESDRRTTAATVGLRGRPAPRFTVRRAVLRDLPDLVALRIALLREEEKNPFFAHPHPDAERRAEVLTRTELAAPGEAFLVAVRDEAIVGMLRCRAVRRSPLVADSHVAVVTTVYVKPAHRRAGVLRALVTAADRWCRRSGLAGMRLQCALTNDVGRKAWEALGFTAAETLYIRQVPRG